MQTAKTTNEHYGFYGTFSLYNNGTAATAWDSAVKKLEAATGHEQENIGAWLDTRTGRHFADQVISNVKMGSELNAAIDKTIEKWNKFHQNPHHRNNGAPACATYLQADIALIAMEFDV